MRRMFRGYQAFIFIFFEVWEANAQTQPGGFDQNSLEFLGFIMWIFKSQRLFQIKFVNFVVSIFFSLLFTISVIIYHLVIYCDKNNKYIEVMNVIYS
jgi:hypothetical protein